MPLIVGLPIIYKLDFFLKLSRRMSFTSTTWLRYTEMCTSSFFIWSHLFSSHQRMSWIFFAAIFNLWLLVSEQWMSWIYFAVSLHRCKLSTLQLTKQLCLTLLFEHCAEWLICDPSVPRGCENVFCWSCHWMLLVNTDKHELQIYTIR